MIFRRKFNLILKTQRLILRPWEEKDAPVLYEYAKDPSIGPQAGWPVHTSVEDSLDIIKTVLCGDQTYAITLKSDLVVVGCIGLTIGERGGEKIPKDSGEVGYWIAKPFWGNGYITEAVNEVLRNSFTNLNLKTIWCGYYEGNEKSRHVQEKCGFTHDHTDYNKECPFIGEIRTEHFTIITKEKWVERHSNYME